MRLQVCSGLLRVACDAAASVVATLLGPAAVCWSRPHGQESRRRSAAGAVRPARSAYKKWVQGNHGARREIVLAPQWSNIGKVSRYKADQAGRSDDG